LNHFPPPSINFPHGQSTLDYGLAYDHELPLFHLAFFLYLPVAECNAGLQQVLPRAGRLLLLRQTDQIIPKEV